MVAQEKYNSKTPSQKSQTSLSIRAHTEGSESYLESIGTPVNFLSRAESDFGEPYISLDGTVLHIGGTDVTDLKFIDLPGMFLNVFKLLQAFTLNR